MSYYEKKKVLVTGGSGYVGGFLCRRLLELGADLRVLVRKTSDAIRVEDLRRRGAELIYGDIRSAKDLERAVSSRELVFHIAALFRQAGNPDSVYYDINLEGVRHVLDAAEGEQVERVVHCSTIGVHSHIPDPPADEEEDYRPGDIYQLTKCEGEKLAQEYFKNGRVPGVVVRPAMIWGDGDLRTLKLFRGVARRHFPVIGDGKTLTHWVYIHDLIDGFLLAGEKREALGRTYIFAGERAVSINDLVSTIAALAGVKPLPFKIPALPVQLLGSVVETLCIPLGIEPPIYRRRVDFFTKTRSFDTTRARSELGYEPRYAFEEEVERIYSWYRDHDQL